MQNNYLFGYTNKIMAEIIAFLMQDKNFCNFTYYTDAKYDYSDITSLDMPSTSQLYDKHFFVYKRVPDVIEEAGAFVYFDIYRDIPTKLGSPIRSLTFTVTILVHHDCVKTIHGHRGICIKDSIELALSNLSNNNSIGDIELSRLSPVLGLVKDYTGYTLQLKVDNFSPRFTRKNGE